MFSKSRRRLIVGSAAAIVGGVQSNAQGVSYGYDALGRLTAMADSSGNSAGYAYDHAGNRTTRVVSSASGGASIGPQGKKPSPPFEAEFRLGSSGPIDLGSLAAEAGYGFESDAVLTYVVDSDAEIFGEVTKRGWRPAVWFGGEAFQHERFHIRISLEVLPGATLEGSKRGLHSNPPIVCTSPGHIHVREEGRILGATPDAIAVLRNGCDVSVENDGQIRGLVL
jgi:YD repeat-containing protein